MISDYTKFEVDLFMDYDPTKQQDRLILRVTQDNEVRHRAMPVTEELADMLRSEVPELAGNSAQSKAEALDINRQHVDRNLRMYQR